MNTLNVIISQTGGLIAHNRCYNTDQNIISCVTNNTIKIYNCEFAADYRISGI